MTDGNPKDAIRRCFEATEKEHQDAIVERDQLRELCGELKNSLRALYWNDCTKHSKAIEDLIAKAEKALGGES